MFVLSNKCGNGNSRFCYYFGFTNNKKKGNKEKHFFLKVGCQPITPYFVNV